MIGRRLGSLDRAQPSNRRPRCWVAANAEPDLENWQSQVSNRQSLSGQLHA
jgi:hypothetical protein